MPEAHFKEDVTVKPLTLGISDGVAVGLFFSGERRPIVLGLEGAIEVLQSTFRVLHEQRNAFPLEMAQLVKELRGDLPENEHAISCDGVSLDFVNAEAGTCSNRPDPQRHFEKVLLLSFATKGESMLLDIGLAVTAVRKLLRELFSSLSLFPGQEMRLLGVISEFEAQYV